MKFKNQGISKLIGCHFPNTTVTRLDNSANSVFKRCFCHVATVKKKQIMAVKSGFVSCLSQFSH